MPVEFGVVIPLWDFAADEGRLLERARGDAGVDFVVAPVVTGPVALFRPAAAPDAPFFRSDGGWHFRPSTRAYSGVALRPRKARWFVAGDVLAQLRERCQELGLRLTARIDLRAMVDLAAENLHVAQRNAWSQEQPSAGPCVVHADTRELLRALLDDLRRYELAGYELVDWEVDLPVDRHGPRPLDWRPAARRLLDICFCASCRQVAERADVDVEAAARAVRERVSRLLSGQPGDAGDDPVVAAYTTPRAADCCTSLKRLGEPAGERRQVLLRDVGRPVLGNTAPWAPMTRVGAAGRDGLAAEWDALRPTLGWTTSLSMPVWRPALADSADLVRRVDEAAKQGVGVFTFDGLTEAPDDAVTWLRQAIRYARRESS